MSTLSTLERDTYEFWAEFAHHPGGARGVAGGAMWFRSGVPFVNYNGVVGAGCDVRDMLARVRAWNVPARWIVSSASADGIGSHVQGVRPDAGGRGARHGGSDCRPAETAFGGTRGRGGHRRPAVAGMGRRASGMRLAYRRRSPGLSATRTSGRACSKKAARISCMRHRGAAVATGLLHSALGIAGVYAIGVRRACRRRGWGALATLLTVREGERRGATEAVLQATSEGFPVYAKLGFQTLCTVPRLANRVMRVPCGRRRSGAHGAGGGAQFLRAGPGLRHRFRIRRPVHVRAVALEVRPRPRAARLEHRVGSRLPARRTAPVADRRRADRSRHPDGRQPDSHPRLSPALQVSRRVHVGAGLLELTDREAESFRAYLLKGGFAVFEDFDGPQQWTNFEAQMRRVLPDGRFVKLDEQNLIFDSFFKIQDINAIVHPMSRICPSYYGVFEDNDPSKRLMVVANFDNDVPEYREWSGRGLVPVRRVERSLQAGRQLSDLRPDALNEALQVGAAALIIPSTGSGRSASPVSARISSTSSKPRPVGQRSAHWTASSS